MVFPAGRGCSLTPYCGLITTSLFTKSRRVALGLAVLGSVHQSTLLKSNLEIYHDKKAPHFCELFMSAGVLSFVITLLI